MKKIRSIHPAVLLLILTVMLSFPPSLLAESSAKVISRVGVIAPLSGEAAIIGTAFQNGITLAIESLPAEIRSQLHFTFEDDGNIPKNTASAFRKLVEQDGVDVIVTVTAAPSMAASPLADTFKVPLISMALPPAIVKDKKFAVLFWSTPERFAGVMVAEAKRRGYKNIARISAIHDGRLAMKEAFDKANNNEFRVVLDEEYTLDARDFRPFLNKLRRLGPIDAIHVNLFVGQIGLFTRQAKELGFHTGFFASEMFENPEEVRSSQGALVGGWYVNEDDPSGSFVERYKSRFPGANLFSAANGHDIVLLIAEGVKRKLDRAAFNDFLHHAQNISGALGTYSATGDNRYDLPVAIKEVTKDGFVRVDR